MASSPLAILAVALLGGGALLPPAAVAAGDPLCAATARHAPADPRIRRAVDEARRQHQLFGGQFIDRNGGLFRAGYYEAEWGRPPGESLAAWQRVATYWQALSDADPPELMTSAGWVTRSEVERAAMPRGSEATSAEVAVHEALLRAAIIDVPWSAAFISYVMKSAGFSRTEFTFSDSHVDYVQAAFATTAAEAAGAQATHAFRACDVASTPPRAGDLLCATRAGSVGVATFDALAAAMATRPAGQAFPMHCELVIRSDEGGDAKIDTIGGNVVQSVTLSRMTLNANKVLGQRYIGVRRASDCAPGGQPCRVNLSRRPWVVVLQFRG